MTDLYCVGCGSLVAEDYILGTKKTIPCNLCRASSAILKDTLGNLLANKGLIDFKITPMGHIELFLGYSDYKSESKDRVMDFLLREGSTSQQYCSNQYCQLQFKKITLEVGLKTF